MRRLRPRGNLGMRFAIDQRQGARGNKREVIGFGNRPILNSMEGNGAFADNARHAIFRAGFKGQEERCQVGVTPHSEVLQVHHEHIESCQHFRGGFTVSAIERVNRDAPLRMRLVSHLFTSGSGPEVTVLGTKERDKAFAKDAAHRLCRGFTCGE